MADGMFGPMPGVFSQQFNMPAPTQSGGMFGGGDSAWKQAALMAIAGFMARRSPQVSSTLLQGYQDKQELAQKLAAAQLERRQAVQDQITVHRTNQAYDAANPVPGEQERMLQRYLDPTTPAAEKDLLRSMIEHPVAMDVTGTDGSVTRQYVYPGSIPQQQAPLKPVGKLTPLGVGGPTPQASGGFHY